MPSSPGWPPRSAPASAWPSPKACPSTGNLTGGGSPYLRGSITGAGTFLGGVLHTLPFLIPAYHAALIVALADGRLRVGDACLVSRARFFSTGFFRSFISVALGGAIIAAVSAAWGAVG